MDDNKEMLYKMYLRKAIQDFRALGSHRPKLCTMTFVSCDNCPLDVAEKHKQTCDHWVHEEEVLTLIGGDINDN